MNLTLNKNMDWWLANWMVFAKSGVEITRPGGTAITGIFTLVSEPFPKLYFTPCSSVAFPEWLTFQVGLKR